MLDPLRQRCGTPDLSPQLAARTPLSGMVIARTRSAGLLGLTLCLAPLVADSCDPGARVYFIKPFNGATVSSPFTVIFGSELVDVKAVPAGRVPENVGHHDLLVNLDKVPLGEYIPADEQHLHFDQGQSSAQLNLSPGKYRLTLQFADGLERSHGPEMSATIQVTVR
jgi:hypothetical protein